MPGKDAMSAIRSETEVCGSKRISSLLSGGKAAKHEFSVSKGDEDTADDS